MGCADPHSPLFLHRRCVDYVFMDRLHKVVVSVVTAPLWFPGYVGIAFMRWAMGRDQSNDA